MFFNYDIFNSFYRTKLFGAKYFSIGTTKFGKQILACHVGTSFGPQLLVQAGIHGREHITCLLCFRQIEYALKNFLGVGGIYFIPMANPDGIDIAINGVKNILCDYSKRELINSFNSNYKLFKANANLVDLNVNFDAYWGQGRRNVFKKASENFIGPKPFSENETIVLKNFVEKIKPCVTISYHCKGEVVYYGFHEKGNFAKLSRNFAKFVSQKTGYKMQKSKGSKGGFKDWAILKKQIPSVTIEVGSDKLSHPLTKNCLNKILKENLKLPVLIVENLVRCDIINSCKGLTKNNKSILCQSRYWKQSVQKK